MSLTVFLLHLSKISKAQLLNTLASEHGKHKRLSTNAVLYNVALKDFGGHKKHKIESPPRRVSRDGRV